MSTKTIEHAEVKALQTPVGADPVVMAHEIEFYALAFNPEPDKQGDVIAPDAADEWLAKFYLAGKPLPVSFRHAALIGAGASDPFSVIGYAPADPEHVWKDDHGIRVRAYLETEINDKAEQVYRLAKRGILTGASAVFMVGPGGEEPGPVPGSTRITKIADVKEAGPCLDPANEHAFVLSVKNEEREKAVDNSEWDGSRALSQCSTAAEFRKVCAGERSVGEPDQRQHWALPHHYLGQHPNPNAAGVRNALARLPQTQGLTNAGAARTHLEAHMREINPERAASVELIDDDVAELAGIAGRLVVKAGRSISARNEKLIRTAMEMLTQALASIAESEDVPEQEAKANTEEPDRPNGHRANVEEPTAWLHEAIADLVGVAPPPAE